MSVHVHGHRAIPILHADILHRRRRTPNAGVVHQHVQAAEHFLDAVKQLVYLFRFRHVGDAATRPGNRGGRGGQIRLRIVRLAD